MNNEFHAASKTNMTENEYWDQIREWERIYGKPSFGAYRYNPAATSATCKRCGKGSGRSSRHHKANDFFFALWMPDVYARRYIEFRPEDCDRLCRRCHVNIERYSKKLKLEMYVEFNTKGTTVARCEAWRQKFLTLYEKWLSRPLRKRKGNRGRKRKVKSSLASK